MLLLVDLEILVDQLRDDPVAGEVLVDRDLRWATDDERRARLVDENRIDLVDDRVDVTALHHRGEVELHVVAQVVEAELVVRAVGDVAAIGVLPLLVAEVVLDAADREPEKTIDATHPLGVAAREVVVHGDDVNSAARERVEVAGESRDERLAFTGAHLGDVPAVQDHAAHELDVEVPHVEHAARRLATNREGLRKKRVERLAELILPKLDLSQFFRIRERLVESIDFRLEAFPELGGLRAELLVGERLHRRLERVDLRDEGDHALDLALVPGSENRRKDLVYHELTSFPRG